MAAVPTKNWREFPPSAGTVVDPAEKKPPLLNSWNEIAQYLGRGVRTVQRWERELQLPVHRVGAGKRSPVYAVVSELKFWMVTSAAKQDLNKSPTNGSKAATGPHDKRWMQLTARLYELARLVAQNSVRHQRQARELRQRIKALRSGLASQRTKS
jgi:hypothetical protein